MSRTAARYDPVEAIGPGRTIIEASAGTGKTFTITAAVTRLVAEEGLSLEEILVVTFTRAATAELKDRVRKRMVETLRALEGRRTGEVDEHMRVLLDAGPEDRKRRAARLGEALNGFDRAQIFTIHGFAMRLLRKLGFRSRLPADAAPGEVDEMLIRRAAGDLVVARFAAGEADEEGGGPIEPVSPEDLAAIGKKLADTPNVRLLPEPAEVEGGMRIRAEMALEMRDLAARRMRSARMITYDDSLVEARDALADPVIGEGARELLRRRYAVALVDESQDTDPIQWQVIRAVFDESRLVIIGDPKQAIYSFRGADIESYLAAAASADAHRTLDTNWRSDGPLISALDSLLTGAVFGDDRIAYIEVSPADRHRRARIEGAGAPLEIRRFSNDFPIGGYKWRGRRFFYVAEARKAVAADAASEIVRMLTAGVTLDGAARDGGDGKRPLGPGDIAVLCRTRRQVDMVREELFARGVPSVAARTGGVFASPAAEQWRRFLYAVERPNRTDHVRMAAVTPLAGLHLDEAAALQDEKALAWQQRFIGWRTLLYERGVPALLGDVDRTTRLAARVLAEPGGERMLTDLAHVAEEMHAVWRRGRLGSLVVWLEAAMDEAARNADANVEDPESRQRRLETDAAAVQVQTIHAAKGLEYPVVLAPYLWDVPRRKPDIPVFHDPEPAPPGEPRPRLVDVGGPDLDDHKEAAMSEEAAEESRLLYVALTRAKHRLVLWWIEQVRGSEETKLHQLLTRAYGDRKIGRKYGVIDETVLDEPVPPVRYEPGGAGLPPLDLARLGRPLDYTWRRVSFSSLSPDRPLAGRSDTAEQADRIDEAAAEADPPPPAPGEELPMAGLPRGARFGSLVHELFDRVPFDAEDLPGAIRAELARLTRRGSWDFDADRLVEGITLAMDTPLGPDDKAPTLRSLDPSRTLKEMNFELPLRAGASAISLCRIAEVALEHLPADDPHRPYLDLLRDPELDQRPFRGCMTGAIDLTALLPGPGGGRYTVMDFKSNTLPALGDAPAPADYGPRPLAAAMHHGNYALQALLYQAALHRYLQWRLAGYRPEAHLGGSMYLFVRGMIGPRTPVVEGERCGVARWSPPPEMIAAVSGLFAGGER